MNLNERMLRKLKAALNQKGIKRKAYTIGVDCNCEVTPNQIKIVKKENGDIIGILEYETHVDEHEVIVYVGGIEIMDHKQQLIDELIKCFKDNVINEYVPGYGEENVIVRMDLEDERFKPIIEKMFGNHGIKLAKNKKGIKRKAIQDWYNEDPWEGEKEIEEDGDEDPWEDEDEIPDFDPEDVEEGGVIILLPGEREKTNIPKDAEVIDVRNDLEFFEFDDLEKGCKHLAVENIRTGKIAVWDDYNGRKLLVSALKSNKNGHWNQISFNNFRRYADRINPNILWKQLIIATI